MKKRIALVLLLPLILGCGNLFGQGNPDKKNDDPKNGKADTKAMKVYPKFRKLSLDFSAGTRGVAVGARYQLGESKWGVRLAVSDFPILYSTSLKLSGYNTNIDLKNDFQGVQLLFDFRPAKNSRFKFIFGVSDFFVGNLTVNMTPTGSYNYGTIAITGDQVGKMNVKLDWSGLAPFIGFGFGSPHPRHKIGCALGLGLYYLMEPVTTVTGTNFLSGNSANAQAIKDNMESFRYLPVVNFHINYRFKKQTNTTL